MIFQALQLYVYFCQLYTALLGDGVLIALSHTYSPSYVDA